MVYSSFFFCMFVYKTDNSKIYSFIRATRFLLRYLLLKEHIKLVFSLLKAAWHLLQVSSTFYKTFKWLWIIPPTIFCYRTRKASIAKTAWALHGGINHFPIYLVITQSMCRGVVSESIRISTSSRNPLNTSFPESHFKQIKWDDCRYFFLKISFQKFYRNRIPLEEPSQTSVYWIGMKTLVQVFCKFCYSSIDLPSNDEASVWNLSSWGIRRKRALMSSTGTASCVTSSFWDLRQRGEMVTSSTSNPNTVRVAAIQCMTKK